MSVRAHAAWSAGAAILLTASRFALLAILARRLDQPTLGLFAYAQWMVDIGFLVGSLGAAGAASRYIAEYRSRPAELQAFVLAWRVPSLLLPISGAVLVVLGAGLTGTALGWQGQLALLVWALFSGLWAMQTAALTGLQRFDLVFAANAAAAGVMLLGAAFAPSLRNSSAAVFLIMGAGCAAGFLFGLAPVQRLSATAAGADGKLDKRAILQYCANIWVTALLWNLVWSRGEVPLVRHFLGNAQLAHYSVALSLVGGAVAGVMLGIGGIAPQVTRLVGEAKMGEAVQLCRTVGDWQLLTSAGAASLLIWLSPELLRVAFGPGYAASAPALSLLAAGLPALSFTMHNHLLQIRTGARFNRNTTLLGLAALAAAGGLLIPRFGIEGAAVARVAALWLLALISAAVFSISLAREGVNRLGFSAVLVSTGTSAGIAAAYPGLPLSIRLAAAIVIPALLVALVRDIHGRPAVGGFLGRMRGAA